MQQDLRNHAREGRLSHKYYVPIHLHYHDQERTSGKEHNHATTRLYFDKFLTVVLHVTVHGCRPRVGSVSVFSTLWGLLTKLRSGWINGQL